MMFGRCYILFGQCFSALEAVRTDGNSLNSPLSALIRVDHVDWLLGLWNAQIFLEKEEMLFPRCISLEDDQLAGRIVLLARLDCLFHKGTSGVPGKSRAVQRAVELGSSQGRSDLEAFLREAMLASRMNVQGRFFVHRAQHRSTLRSKMG